MQVAEPEGFSEKQEKKGSRKRRKAGQPHFATDSGTFEEPAPVGGRSLQPASQHSAVACCMCAALWYDDFSLCRASMTSHKAHLAPSAGDGQPTAFNILLSKLLCILTKHPSRRRQHPGSLLPAHPKGGAARQRRSGAVREPITRDTTEEEEEEVTGKKSCGEQPRGAQAAAAAGCAAAH